MSSCLFQQGAARALLRNPQKVFDIVRGRSSKSSAIFVSPLISLMKDQVHSLAMKGVNSIYVIDMSDGMDGLQEQKLYEGGLFFSPEQSMLRLHLNVKPVIVFIIYGFVQY